MHAFIVRPFGVKNGIDFDLVDRELISAALARLQITGRTTGEIARAGNIRADMFHLLLIADLVVADITIHNANVFYELGVRQALRDKRTFLLRANIDEVPFDLKTDRYLSYDAKNPAASLDALVKALADTCRSEVVDSPVYAMLPGLTAPDAAAFVVVPNSFREEVKRARLSGTTGDLRFLASELSGLAWRREGLRVVGEAQFKRGDLKYAAETWEWVRMEVPNDTQANLRLGTIYQKLGDLVRSDEALERVVAVPGRSAPDAAEARALLGSNAKTRWQAAWTALPTAEQRQAEALRSAFLTDSLDAYRKGFESDLSNYYSGLSALSMITILTELAAAQPGVWQERFEDKDSAALELKKHGQLRSQLCGAVEFSLGAGKQRLERDARFDDWLALSFADYAFIMAKPNARQLYREALDKLEPFAISTARRQFEIFQALGIALKIVELVAPLFPVPEAGPAPTARQKVLVFTGHRIDASGRSEPRFPADQEATARQAIREAVQRELPADGRPVLAIAGGAGGGDLLFHEVCEELGIRQHNLYLIIPRDAYVMRSVAPAGADWVVRFNRQYDQVPHRQYQDRVELPDWLQDKPDYGIWKRSNIWILHNAIALGGEDTTLIALWDGKGGDGPGGTEDMVETATKRGARTIVLDTKRLFGLG